jgi:hypothetical protein
VTDFRGTQYAIEGGTVDSFHHWVVTVWSLQ